MKRLILLLLLTLTLVPFASANPIDASERGWVCLGSGAHPCIANNGAGPANNYFAGFLSGVGQGQFRDWYEFAIPSLSGSLVSATLNLYDRTHYGGSLTYVVYPLSAQPLVFGDFKTDQGKPVPHRLATSRVQDQQTTPH